MKTKFDKRVSCFMDDVTGSFFDMPRTNKMRL